MAQKSISLLHNSRECIKSIFVLAPKAGETRKENYTFRMYCERFYQHLEELLRHFDLHAQESMHNIPRVLSKQMEKYIF